MESLVYATVASQAQNGPLVQSVSAGTVAQLAYAYAFNYPAFVSQAASLINQDVQQIEVNEPEGQRNALLVTGWNGQAAAAAQAINQQWQAGKVTGADGQPVAAWPEFPDQIAWAADGGNTLVVRWLKEEWQLYLLVGVLLVVVGLVVYRILTQNAWSLQTASPQTAASTGNPVIQPPSGTQPLRFFGLAWYWWVGGAGALAVSPWAYRKIVELKQDRAASLRANRALEEAE